MEENNNDNFNDSQSVVLFDIDGLIRETVSLEEITEEGENDFDFEDESGSDNDIMRNVIDYAKLEASVRDAQIINTLDSDLNDLPVSDVILLIIALLIGIIIIGGKGK